MNVSTTDPVLTPGSAIDLHLHTVYSDGKWMPEDLIDHLLAEGFALAAITDHDRVDTVASLQELARAKGLPLLVGTEMTTTWQGSITDILCYGYEPANSAALGDLAAALLHAQQENTRQAYDYLCRNGHIEEVPPEELAAILQTPAAQMPFELVALAHRQGGENLNAALNASGLKLETSEPAAVVEAGHRCGALCLIAHPGRSDGFCCFDWDLLDRFRQEIPIDGLEAHYPRHTPDQVALYLEYAQQHDLLVSSGSDSHEPAKPPIKYRAELSRALLERLGIQMKEKIN